MLLGTCTNGALLPTESLIPPHSLLIIGMSQGYVLLADAAALQTLVLMNRRAAREEARAAGDEEDDSESDSETGSIDAGPEVLETPVVPLIQSTGAKKTTESSNKYGLQLLVLLDPACVSCQTQMHACLAWRD